MASNIEIKPTSSVRNLGVIFDKHLNFHEHITKISQACFFHIRDLRRIRPHLTLSTATVIETALVQSKLDYCNSLFVNLPDCEISRLQYIQNSLARAIYRSPKSCHISPILKSLHWLKIHERISYKVISLTFKLLLVPNPGYLAELIQVRQLSSTRSSKYLSLDFPPLTSRNVISNRAFQEAAPQLWKSLPKEMRKPHPDTPAMPALSLDEFHRDLKTFLFKKSHPEL